MSYEIQVESKFYGQNTKTVNSEEYIVLLVYKIIIDRCSDGCGCRFLP